MVSHVIKANPMPDFDRVFKPQLPHTATETLPFMFEERYKDKPSRETLVQQILQKEKVSKHGPSAPRLLYQRGEVIHVFSIPSLPLPLPLSFSPPSSPLPPTSLSLSLLLLLLPPYVYFSFPTVEGSFQSPAHARVWDPTAPNQVSPTSCKPKAFQSSH